MDALPMESSDFEAQLAGKWLHLTGLLLVFLGTGFFLKVAFDHNWIEPAYRVALGLAGGAAIVSYAQFLARKGQRYFSEGLTALGTGIEFLSLYASCALFHLVSPSMALAGMAAVNAVIAALAWRRRSERLGILAAVGGFLAPLLAGTQSADPWMLAGYVGLLDAGLLLLTELVDSKVVAPMALAGTFLYSAGIFSHTPAFGEMQRALVYAALYAPFAVAAWLGLKVRGALDPFRSIVGAAAFGGFALGLETALWPGHRMLLGGALLLLAAAHLGAAVALKSRYQSWISVVALSLAVPAAMHRAELVTIAFAGEAALLAFAGLRLRDEVLKWAGLALLALDLGTAVNSYVGQTYPDVRPVLNERFAACVAALVAIYATARAIDFNGLSEYDVPLVRTLRTIGHVFAAGVLSAEAWAGVAYYGGAFQAQSAALSVVGAIFATLLIASGLYKRDAFVRWEGLGLIVATAIKVLAFDLSFLDLGYRVMSAVLVGVALIGISYAYQRRSRAGAPC